MMKTVKNVIMRVEAMMAGYRECRGVFRVLDRMGQPLGDVSVSYRVGNSEWVFGGRSCDLESESRNYIQPSAVFYQIGEPVAWCFSKPGYAEKTILRYTADTTFNEKLNTVVMLTDEEMAAAMNLCADRRPVV
ncbi:hypothetical protein P4C99_14500 [Pontiellaceae bacterium B1224]|nr:hypothetical protein [Pontiellaceae bacterium B1224]